MLNSNSPFSSVEKLESRSLYSASPVDFAGQYVGGKDNVAYEVSIRQSATVKTSYTGDFLIAGFDLKLAATESSASVLKGSITQLVGKPTSFTATLKGNLLTLVSGGETALLAKFSSTPAPALPTLYPGKGKYFSYEAPKGWKVAQSTGQIGGIIVFASPDGSEGAGTVGAVVNGHVGTSGIVNSEIKEGETFVDRVQLVNTAYEQQEVDFITNTSKGTVFDVGQVITSFFDAAADKTVIVGTIIQAPQAQFADDALALCDMLQTVRPV